MNLVIKTVQYNFDDVDTKIVYSVRYTGFDIGFYRIEILKNFERHLGFICCLCDHLQDDHSIQMYLSIC